MSIHAYTPDHLLHIANFWDYRIDTRYDAAVVTNDGTPCKCCGNTMHAGLLHYLYKGKHRNAASMASYEVVEICTDCAAKYAEYKAFCAGTCNDCGSPVYDADGEWKDPQGKRVCLTCFDDAYVECADCGEIIEQADAQENDDGKPICNSCRDDYFTCDHCGKIIRDSDGTWISGEEVMMCESCLEAHYSRCEDCGKYIPNDESYTLASGDVICGECYSTGDYNHCEDCGEIFHSDNGEWSEDDNAWYCADCQSNHSSRNIHEYGYKPEWIWHQTAQDRLAYPRIPDRFYLGIELEVENKGHIRDNDEVAEEVIATVPAVCKEDGSINNGFEIVFHPQTFAYATTDGRKPIENMLADLRRANFAGHNYGGMHVHITRTAFTQLHLYKFHQLFLQCSSLFTCISQRQSANLQHWGSFENMGHTPGFQNSRYAALNYTPNTVEVRIFNSTIRTDRFFKNLEAVKAALDFTKQYGIRDMLPGHFLRFIMDNRAQYKNLVAFLVECHAGTLTAVNVDARAIRQVQKSLSRRCA